MYFKQSSTKVAELQFLLDLRLDSEYARGYFGLSDYFLCVWIKPSSVFVSYMSVIVLLLYNIIINVCLYDVNVREKLVLCVCCTLGKNDRGGYIKVAEHILYFYAHNQIEIRKVKKMLADVPTAEVIDRSLCSFPCVVPRCVSIEIETPLPFFHLYL